MLHAHPFHLQILYYLSWTCPRLPVLSYDAERRYSFNDSPNQKKKRTKRKYCLAILFGFWLQQLRRITTWENLIEFPKRSFALSSSSIASDILVLLSRLEFSIATLAIFSMFPPTCTWGKKVSHNDIYHLTSSQTNWESPRKMKGSMPILNS